MNPEDPESEGPSPRDGDIWFGPFCLRPAAHLLLQDGVQVRIGGRALDLLTALVARAGEVVSKDELFAQVWPGLAVDEGNLRAQIALVRKALREREAGARYLMTIAGRGYCFVAPISRSAKSSGTSDAPVPENRSRLPSRLTRLIGRVDAVGDIVGHLKRHRFVTILGPGGIGKTSVAFAVADQMAAHYPDGNCVADCASLLGTSLVARKLASTLGLEIADDDPTRGLVAFLAGRRMLIILDCCERVVEDAANLAENLLKGATDIGILVTSREPLRAEGEIAYRLSPLDVPPAAAALNASEALGYSAVELFVERVMSSDNRVEFRDVDAPVIAEICRKLDGIALAIELAAGRVDVFGVPGVAAQLEDRLGILTHGRRTALPRHQTLTATLDWSYDTLSETEQTVLRRFSVFVGDFDLADAQAVAGDDPAATRSIIDSIIGLVSKSLLNADVARLVGRYRLLDTTRAYAFGKLKQSEEFGSIARRHSSHIQEMVGRAAAALAASSSTARAAGLLTESRLVDEVRAVLDRAFSTDGDVEAGIALTVASVPLWTHLSLNSECRRYVEQALLAGEAIFGPDDRQKMQLLAALSAAVIYTKGPSEQADAARAEALEIAESIGDSDYQVRVLWGLWSNQFNTGRLRMSLDTARKLRTVAESHGDIAAALVGERSVGMSQFYLGEHSSSRRHTESMLRRYRRPSDRSDIIRFQFDPRVVSRTLLSKLLWAQGFPDQANREVRGLIDEATDVGHAMSLALALAQGACPVTLLSGDLAAAEGFIQLLLKHTAENALELWHSWGTSFAAMLLIARGRVDEGLSALQQILGALPKGAFFAHYAGIHATLAEALGRTGAVSQGHTIIDEALLRANQDDERWYMAEFLRVKGELLRLEETAGSEKEAEQHFKCSLDCARTQEAPSWGLRTSVSLARLYRDRGKAAEARHILMVSYSSFTEGFQTADLRIAKALLDSLS